MSKTEGCTQEIAFRAPLRAERCAGESSTGCGKAGPSIGENLGFRPIAEGFLALTFQDKAVSAGDIDINCLGRSVPGHFAAVVEQGGRAYGVQVADFEAARIIALAGIVETDHGVEAMGPAIELEHGFRPI
jgi:hypothetical protein